MKKAGTRGYGMLGDHAELQAEKSWEIWHTWLGISQAENLTFSFALRSPFTIFR